LILIAFLIWGLICLQVEGKKGQKRSKKVKNVEKSAEKSVSWVDSIVPLTQKVKFQA